MPSTFSNGDADLADAEVEIEDVVLTAPDVGHDAFDSHFKPKLNALARNLTVYVSSNDRALLMSRLVNRTRNFHNFSLETPEFFDDLFLRLTNDTTPSARGLYKTRTAEGRVYWVLTRGR